MQILQLQIRDFRLASLQKSGEENWKKKVPKINIENQSPVLDIFNSNMVNDDDNNEVVQLRKKTSLNSSDGSNRPVSIVDRLSKLEAAQKNWTNRVGDKDTKEESGEDVVQLRTKKMSLNLPKNEENYSVQTKKSVGSLMDRMSKLDEAQKSWSNRVGEKDAVSKESLSEFEYFIKFVLFLVELHCCWQNGKGAAAESDLGGDSNAFSRKCRKKSSQDPSQNSNER